MKPFSIKYFYALKISVLTLFLTLVIIGRFDFPFFETYNFMKTLKIVLLLVLSTIGFNNVNAQDIEERSLNVELSVGSTAGGHAVTSTGGATYTIPINIPKGTANMEPNIALTYNSQSSSGVAGRGWNIAGLSSITRAPETYYHNGLTEGVDLLNSNNFSIDGSIFNLNGTSAVVPKENPSYKITPINSWGGAPVWFKVEVENGLIMEFGNTTDSRFMTNDNSTPLIWNVSKVYDQYGNYMEFKYNNSHRQPRIVQILYTGNNVEGLSPYNEVNFYYNSLPNNEINENFIAGSSIASKYILSGITSRTHNTTYRDYVFEYTQNFYTLLKSVTEKGINGAEYNPTLFQYGDNTASIVSEPSTSISNADVVSGQDFNNDGKSDILLWNKTTTSGIDFVTGWDAKVSDGNNNFTSYASGSVNTGTWKIGSSNISIDLGVAGKSFDFNGDGKTDILLSEMDITSGDSKLTSIDVVFINGLNSTSPPLNIYQGTELIEVAKYMYTADFDGDGRDEIITFTRPSNSSPYNIKLFDYNNGAATVTSIPSTSNLEWLPYAKDVHIVDFDGDGKQELMPIFADNIFSSIFGITNSCEIIEFSNFSGSIQATSLYSATFSGYPNEHHNIFPGDFNGDGKTDLLTHVIDGGNYLWETAFSTGNSFITSPNNITIPYLNLIIVPNLAILTKAVIGDFNGDGKSDVLIRQSSGVIAPNVVTHLHKSLGKQFAPIESTPSPNLESLNIGDFNGDGIHDLFNVTAANTSSIYYPQKNSKKWLLHTVSDGLARLTKFNYQTLAEGNASFYTKNNSASYPYRDAQPTLNVVEHVKKENGIGNEITTNYKYKGAILNLQGKGFLGFTSTEQINTTGSGIVSYNVLNTTYAQFLPQYKNTYVNYPSTLNTIETYAYDIVENNPNNIVWTKLSRVITKHVLRNNYTTTTSYIWDNNNRTNTSISINKGVVEVENITNDYTVTHNHDGWRRNVLDRKLSTVTRSGETPITRKMDYQYNGNNTLIREITDQGTPFEITTDFNNINNFGLAENITVSGNGITTNRTKELTYDTDGRFVIKQSNSISQDVFTSYHQTLGTVKTVTGIDGLTTEYSYDGFGRQTAIATPDGLVSTSELKFEQSANAPFSLYSNKIEEPGKPFFKTYYDKFERELETRTQAFNGDIIYTNTTYDFDGNVSTTKSPYTLSQAPITSIYTYDIIYKNRLLSVTNSMGSTLYGYGFNSGYLTLTTTAPDNTTSSKTTDYTGVLTAATDNGGILTYKHYSSGLQKEVLLDGTSISTMEYDLLGNQTKLIDNNAGLTKYVYNNFGELIEQEDANGNIFEMTYDVLGRLTDKIGSGNFSSATNYSYRQSMPGINQLETVSSDFNGANMSETYEYDYLNRIKKQTETIDGQNYDTEYTYDGFNNLATTTYPSSFETTNEYNNLGYLTAVTGGGNRIWSGTTMNTYGQYTNTYKGPNNLHTEKTYDQYGFPEHFYSSGVQDLEFDFNVQNGNLDSRYNGLKLLLEEFEYDNLNRLERSEVTNMMLNTILNPIVMDYDDNGNIDEKTDAGTYTYDPANRTNALITLTNISSNISADQQDLTYNSFNSPLRIEEGNHILDLDYGPNEQRKKTIYNDGNNITNKYFLGNYEIIEDDASGDQTHVHYIAGGDGLAAMYVIDPNGNDNMYYVYSDHLGSILTLTDDQGNVEVEQNFDAWGRERDVDTWEYANATPVGNHSNFEWMQRGYTGHEHLSAFALINMNGRVYDPIVGRMLSVDNFVQDATNTQSFNRYSYVLNNPLKYTDPSGEEFVLAGVVVIATFTYLQAVEANDWQWNPGKWGSKNKAGEDIYYSGGIGGNANGVNSFNTGVGVGGSGRTVTANWDAQAAASGPVNINWDGVDFWRHRGEGTSFDNSLYEGTSLANGTGNMPGIDIYETSWMSGGITLPPFGIVVQDGASKGLKQHEYGHYLQYKSLGFYNFYKDIGGPSLYNAAENMYEKWYYGNIKYSIDHHYNYAPETDANRRSQNYFGPQSEIQTWSTDTRYPQFNWYQRLRLYTTDAWNDFWK